MGLSMPSVLRITVNKSQSAAVVPKALRLFMLGVMFGHHHHHHRFPCYHCAIVFYALSWCYFRYYFLKLLLLFFSPILKLFTFSLTEFIAEVVE